MATRAFKRCPFGEARFLLSRLSRCGYPFLSNVDGSFDLAFVLGDGKFTRRGTRLAISEYTRSIL